MEFADVAKWSVHPTSTGRLMAFKLSQVHLGCFFSFFFGFSLWSLCFLNQVFRERHSSASRCIMRFEIFCFKFLSSVNVCILGLSCLSSCVSVLSRKSLVVCCCEDICLLFQYTTTILVGSWFPCCCLLGFLGFF